ncbi:MAG: uroporphyrinogen decarboxylase [Gammaproteobacteria bacterium]|jgi:uroporphyrinogen decarboxylase|nr:uroporphyrinogen decarboxylase [Gammaproteobacteria bacterium]
MPVLQNDRFLRALLRQEIDYTPVWIMRQAGRYLPEYRALRKKTPDFLTFCKTPELACEATLQPLQRYPLDAAIVFSDILTIPDAMGLGLYFTEGEGPRFKNPIRSISDIAKLHIPDPMDDLGYVCQTITMVRQHLQGKVPLIGFAGSPWTLATYMIEGGSSKQFENIKGMMYREPNSLHQLLTLLTESVTIYLNAQIASGAQAVMLFDTWGGVLTTDDYRDFSLNYMEQIINDLTWEHEGRRVPVILFTKGSGLWLEMIAETGCDGIGVDWTIPLSQARERVGHKAALQGNLDPCVLLGSKQRIYEEVQSVLNSYGPGSGHIFNLGHGILPSVPPENVAYLIEVVHELSQVYHRA